MRVKLTIRKKRTRSGSKLVPLVKPDWIALPREPRQVAAVLPSVLGELKRRAKRK